MKRGKFFAFLCTLSALHNDFPNFNRFLVSLASLLSRFYAINDENQSKFLIYLSATLICMWRVNLMLTHTQLSIENT